jgi:uncharacterized RDD family membrane protein YckC
MTILGGGRAMSNDGWYYAQNNQQLGPVSLETLRGMVAAGRVGAADLVWAQGMAQWQPARSVPEVGSALLGGGGGGGGGGDLGGGSMYGSPAGYAPAGSVGQLGYGVAPSYYQQQYQHFDYAGFWLRFCAIIIDYIIIVLPFVILGQVVEHMGPSTTNPRTGMPAPNPATTGLVLAINLAQIIAMWLYFALQESGPVQATLGKRAVGIKVTDLEGRRIGFGHATGRHFAKILSGCTLYIGFIMAGFTEKKQGLHDIVAGTLVVKK